MCFSDPRHKIIKGQLQTLQTKRRAYTDSVQIPRFTYCMIKYMQQILRIKFTHSENMQNENRRQNRQYSPQTKSSQSFFGCLPCFKGINNYKNVRKQFQKAFKSCSASQQYQFYKKFVWVMVQNQLPAKQIAQQPSLGANNENSLLLPTWQGMKFNVQLKGSITWASSFEMILYPQKYTIVVKDQKLWSQTTVNLRNYILRKSKHIKDFTYVLEGIVTVQPSNLRFSIINQKNQDARSIADYLFKIYDQALKLNVQLWKQPVVHIKNNRQQNISVKKAVNSLFQSTTNLNSRNAIDKLNKKSPQAKNAADNKLVDPLTAKIKDKVKMGVARKLIQYNQDQNLKQQNNAQSSIPVPVEQQEILIQQQQQTQKQKEMYKKTNNMQKYFKRDLSQNLISLNIPKQQAETQQNISIGDRFKKKKSSMSEYQFNQIRSPKRKPGQKKNLQIINYAIAPSDTRSQTGNFKQRTFQNRLTKANMLSRDKQVQKPDSAKGLIYECENKIYQEQQFGNASQMSRDSQLSFKTIPQAQQFK